jgi:hypothetical protein
MTQITQQKLLTTMSSIKNISLYIPHVFANYSKEDVIAVFEDFKIGEVKNVDFVSKLGSDGKPFNAAYVHFNHWNNNSYARYFQEKVTNPNKEARLIYDTPWFWIVLENKSRKFAPDERKPRIDLSEFSQQDLPVSRGDLPVSRVEMPAPAPVVNQATVDVQMDAQMEAEMEECENAMDEEDAHLISIDSRYVAALEQETRELRAFITCTQRMLLNEQIKTQTFAEAIKLLQR